MRLIDADWLLDRAVPMGWSTPKWVSDILIKDAPTIEPQRKSGKWVKYRNTYYSCSKCNSLYRNANHWNFCPSCGSLMTVDDEKYDF